MKRKNSVSVTLPDDLMDVIEQIASEKYHENRSATMTELFKDGVLVYFQKLLIDRENYANAVESIMNTDNSTMDYRTILKDTTTDSLLRIESMLKKFQERVAYEILVREERTRKNEVSKAESEANKEALEELGEFFS